MNWLDRFRKKVGGPKLPSQQARVNDEPRVQVYDVPTGTLSTIPARELAPGMVRVTINGVEGDCWVRPDQLQQSPYQHPPFDEEARAYLHQIKDALDEVHPMSLEEWEDGFRRDRNAEREIAIWLHIAQVYVRLTKDKSVAPGERQDVFRILLACANNPRERVLAMAGVQVLSRPEAEAVMEEFYGIGPGEGTP